MCVRVRLQTFFYESVGRSVVMVKVAAAAAAVAVVGRLVGWLVGWSAGTNLEEVDQSMSGIR